MEAQGRPSQAEGSEELDWSLTKERIFVVDYAKLFTKVVVPIYSWTSRAWKFQVLCILAKTCIISFKILNISRVYTGMVVLTCISLITNDEFFFFFFQILISHLNILFFWSPFSSLWPNFHVGLSFMLICRSSLYSLNEYIVSSSTSWVAFSFC